MIILKYFIIGNGFHHKLLYQQFAEIKPDKISHDVKNRSRDMMKHSVLSVDFIVLMGP